MFLSIPMKIVYFLSQKKSEIVCFSTM